VNKFHKVKKLCTALSIVGALIISSHPASAHTELVKSSPRADKTISVMPTSVKLTFGEALLVISGSSKQSNSITVKSPSGKTVSTGKVQVTKNIATVNLLKLKESGKYQVTFRVVAEDGHVLKDSFKFEFRK
jgi:methionine-rich copper-binding protein CopC